MIEPRYPDVPGFKVAGTSALAAKQMLAKDVPLRERCLQVLREHGPMTPDRCAIILHETSYSIRPRFTQLWKLFRIRRVGTGLSENGSKQYIYAAID